MERVYRRALPRWLGRLLFLLAVAATTVPITRGVAPEPALVSATSFRTDRSAPGAAGLGDPYFPLLGNGGYDVRHYALDLDLDIAAGTILGATATIKAVATQDLSAFNLDFRGPEIAGVIVEGLPATWERDGGELTVTPAAPLPIGSAFTTVVHYHGMPDGGEDRFTRGWWATGRSIATVGEPAGADVWYPVNGHPLDKAAYTLRITVPEPYEVVANGRLVATAHRTGGGGPATRTFVWENPYPTASYLVGFHAADLDVERRSGPQGIALLEAFPPDLTRKERRAFARVPEMLELFAWRFGPYPFAAFGGTVLEDSAFDAALETQEMVAYDRSALGESKVAHELAHQWFGNSVSLERWRDIWLNEGFASYAQVLWIEETRGAEAARAALRRRASALVAASEQPEGAGVRIGDPGPGRLTSPVVYSGGALLLAALRERMGDDAFFRLLQEWTHRHRHGHADTQDFIALAEEVAQAELDAFFAAWLDQAWTPELVAALAPELAPPAACRAGQRGGPPGSRPASGLVASEAGQRQAGSPPRTARARPMGGGAGYGSSNAVTNWRTAEKMASWHPPERDVASFPHRGPRWRVWQERGPSAPMGTVQRPARGATSANGCRCATTARRGPGSRTGHTPGRHSTHGGSAPSSRQRLLEGRAVVGSSSSAVQSSGSGAPGRRAAYG